MKAVVDQHLSLTQSPDLASLETKSIQLPKRVVESLGRVAKSHDRLSDPLCITFAAQYYMHERGLSVLSSVQARRACMYGISPSEGHMAR